MPAGPIALLTDFGNRDHFAASMKGAILTICPQAAIVDITHCIPAQDIRSAAFVLYGCHLEFPEGTIFVCVVDPGVGSDRRAILVETADRFFIGPDNGIFSFLINDPKGSSNGYRAFHITNERFFRHPVSHTFHGRDVFAPTAAHLALGLPPAEFGPLAGEIETLPAATALRGNDSSICAEVIYIDHFGNLITNIPSVLVSRSLTLDIEGHHISRLVDHYSQAATGELFAIVGSAGLLEICANCGSAASILTARLGTPVTLSGNAAD